MQTTIHLRTIDDAQVTAWKQAFRDVPNIEISHGNFFSKDFERTLKGFDAVVSPANSFGYMGGGLDKHLRDHFGMQLEKAVQEKIKTDFAGELPVSQCTMVLTGHDSPKYLIVCPTVRTAADQTANTVNAYLAFKGLLYFLKQHPELKRVLVPGLCSGVAGMPPFRSAIQMLFAWNAYSGKKMPQGDIVDILKIYDCVGESGMRMNDVFMRTIRQGF